MDDVEACRISPSHPIADASHQQCGDNSVDSDDDHGDSDTMPHLLHSNTQNSEHQHEHPVASSTKSPFPAKTFDKKAPAPITPAFVRLASEIMDSLPESRVDPVTPHPTTTSSSPSRRSPPRLNHRLQPTTPKPPEGFAGAAKTPSGQRSRGNSLPVFENFGNKSQESIASREQERRRRDKSPSPAKSVGTLSVARQPTRQVSPSPRREPVPNDFNGGHRGKRDQRSSSVGVLPSLRVLTVFPGEGCPDEQGECAKSIVECKIRQSTHTHRLP